nr:S-layer homology domain-containing protein [Butyricicoccus sp. AF10-3]
MLKKNMRKRLLAGALATIMALTMCPTWALADNEGITTLPAPEDQMPVVDSTPAEDTIQTPDAGTQGQPEAQDPAQAPSGGTDIEETGNNSSSNENDSQNNDAVSNSPANTISLQEVQIDRAWNWQQEAKYFVLLPNRDKPTSGESQGQESYLPNDTSDGGVTDRDNFKGYKGYLTAKGKKIADKNYSIYDATNGYTKIDGVESEYLDPPENLGFFTKANWSEDGKTYIKDSNPSDPFSVLGENFNVNNIRVVWYTIKYQVDGYHVDGYVAGVPVKVTYHSNYGTIPGTTDDSREVAAMSGDTYTVLDNMFTVPTGFSFGGWYVDGNKYEVGSKHLLMTDLHLYAKWVPNPYTVTWKNSDDAVDSLDTQAVNYNGYPTKDPRDQASKASDAQYTYEFKGWKLKDDKTDTIVEPKERAVTENVTYVAVFTPITRQYTVTWKNADDAVDSLDTEKVDYNNKPTEDPKDQASKASDAQYTYEFAGWKLAGTEDTALVNPKERAVTADVTYIAVFKPITRQYTVTWKNSDDAVDPLATQTVAYNNKPTENPTASKASDKDYNYTFKGWKVSGTEDTQIVEPTNLAVTADVTYIAVFDKTARQKNYNYTINKHFYNEKDVEVNVVNGVATSAVENTEIEDLYTANKQETFKNQTYVYVPGRTKVTDNLEKLTKDVTIDLYYYLDVKGGEKPDETGNGTPDAWEYRLAFKVVNGEWNNGGNADIVVYVPFQDYKTGKTLEYVVVPITRIPAVGDKPNSGYRAGSWDTTPVGNAKVEKDTVFTYTYARRSSSGGGGGGSRKPTVTIPDDVPTGLNGDDHYAYIVGYPDSTVRPQNGITRAEVATIFFRLLTDEIRNANSTKSNSYSDVAAGAWYNHAVSTLSAMGIVKGDSHGKFNPNAPITRAEFAAIAARFDDKANTTAVDFSDIASHWAKNEISAAANNGWINGYTDGTFRPNNKITRAEAMTLVNRVLKRLPETAEDLHNDMIKWSDNSDTSAWYYLAVQEATNSHYYGIKENKYEKWSKLRETRDWTELEK